MIREDVRDTGMAGSEKQIAWALRIKADIGRAGQVLRAEMIRLAGQRGELGPVLPRGLDLLDRLLSLIQQIDDAGWLIQLRPQPYTLCGRSPAAPRRIAEYLASIEDAVYEFHEL